MEPAGVAIGAIGLLSLFKTCLEVIETFDNYKNSRTDSYRLTAQFEADRLRFEKWGRAVGFEQGEETEGPHEALNDPRMYSTVKNVLSAIQHILSDAEDLLSSSRVRADMSSTGQKRLHKKDTQPHQSRLKWALIDRPRRVAQVSEFGKLVQTLHNLVSPNATHNVHAGLGKPMVNNGMQFEYD